MNTSCLKEAYSAADNGNEVRMLLRFNEYYQRRNMQPSESVKKGLYKTLIKALEHNIRRDTLFALGTDENPRFSDFDLRRVKSAIDELIEAKAQIA